MPTYLTDNNPDWHDNLGPVTGNGVTDDTDAIQRVFTALDPAGGIRGADLVIPPGRYKISDRITSLRFSGKIRGPGVGNDPVYGTAPTQGEGAVWLWRGNTNTKPMLQMRDYRNVEISGLRFDGGSDATKRPLAGIQSWWQAGDDTGAAGQLHITDCVFGAWPWGVDGAYTGKLQTGVHFGGTDGNNDQFRISGCTFADASGIDSYGIKIDNAQSVWGTVDHCFFDELGIPVQTRAHLQMRNVQFNRNTWVDINVLGTARVNVWGYQSEFSNVIAKLAPSASLRMRDGYAQLHTSYMANDTAMFDLWPSNDRQALVLEGMHFPRNGTYTKPPYIRFGTDRTSGNSASQSGFLIKVDDCTELTDTQIRQYVPPGQVPMYAQGPHYSKGIIEWSTRHPWGHTQFRNQMAYSPIQGTGAKSTIRPTVWDPPTGGTRW